MVFPSSLNVPVMRCENSGASLHIFHTPPSRLICKILETPRSSEASMQHVPTKSSWPMTLRPLGMPPGCQSKRQSSSAPSTSHSAVVVQHAHSCFYSLCIQDVLNSAKHALSINTSGGTL